VKTDYETRNFSTDERTMPPNDQANAPKSGAEDGAPGRAGDSAASRLASIVIPCYNGAKFLPEAIESCLRQTHRELEIIIVDDASPDNCAEIAERYARRDERIRVIRHEKNGGVSRAFNTGFNAAKGEFMIRLAQDDFLHESTVAAMVRHLESNAKVGLTYGNLQAITEDGTLLLGVARVPEASRALLWRNGIGLCVMWRRAVWERVGKFDPAFDTGEDFDYWVRVSKQFPLSKCPGGPFLFARTHDHQGSTLFAERQEAVTIKIIERLFPADSLRNYVLRRRALSYNFYSAATDYSYRGSNFLALRRMIRSFVLWPLPLPGEGGSIPRLLRVKSFIVIILRILHLKRHTPLSSSPKQTASSGAQAANSSRS
jgi:glycosyltransferase involved in cell wall biosynthesis